MCGRGRGLKIISNGWLRKNFMEHLGFLVKEKSWGNISFAA